MGGALLQLLLRVVDAEGGAGGRRGRGGAGRGWQAGRRGRGGGAGEQVEQTTHEWQQLFPKYLWTLALQDFFKFVSQDLF